MYNKLSNSGWKELIEEYNSLRNDITGKDFCIEKNVDRRQFYYHKKRLENQTDRNKGIFQSVPIKTKSSSLSLNNEVRVEIGNAIINIPASETALISSIIKELVLKC